MSVLGLLMVGLTQGFRTGVAFWMSQSRRTGETTELETTARILRHLLTNIPSRPQDSDAGPVSILFDGHRNSLTFVGDLPTGFGQTGRAKISLILRGENLALDWTPHRHEAVGSPEPRPAEAVLMQGVQSLELAYWGETENTTGWLTEWVRPVLPELIRVRLTFGKGPHRRWPDLIAAPQLSNPAH